MNCVIWNIRGVGGTSSQQQLWYLRNKHQLNIMVILEPMVQLDSFLYCTRFRMNKVVANKSNKIWVFF